MPEDPGQGGGRRPGEDAQDELAAPQVRADLAPDPVEHLGLDPEQDDVGAADGLDVVGHGPDAVLALEGLAPFRARMAGDDLLGLDQLAAGSSPAIIASAMTPEPTVAIVALDRGDIARSIAIGLAAPRAAGPARAPRSARRSRRGQPATAVPSTKNRPVVVTSTSSKPGRGERGGQLVRRVVDLDDRELAAVVEPTDGPVVGRGRVVGGAGRRIGQRVDEREPAAGLAASAGRGRGTRRSRSRSTWLSQNPVNSASATPIRLGPRVADVEVGPQPVRDEALAGAIEGRRRRVVQRQLALRGEQRRPPAGAGRQLDDPAADRQPVQPATGPVELRVPGGIVDGAPRVATATQVPVVVLGGARLVVGDHVVASRPERRRNRAVGVAGDGVATGGGASCAVGR